MRSFRDDITEYIECGALAEREDAWHSDGRWVGTEEDDDPFCICGAAMSDHFEGSPYTDGHAFEADPDVL